LTPGLVQRLVGHASLRGEFFRFVIVRGACAVVTYGAYLLLLRAVTYTPAYVASYALGIVLAYVANSHFVFRAPMKRRAAMRFPAVYLFQFVANYLALRILVEVAGVPASWALAISIGVTIPLTFVLSRWIIRAG